MAIGRTDSIRDGDVAPAADAVAARPVRTRRWRSDRYNEILRGFGLIAGALPTVIGLIAVARVNWSLNGFSSPAVRVAGMTFTPWIAVATVIGGLLALSAAAAPTREPKLGLGALYVCGGLAVMIAQPTIDHVTLTYRFGVMTFLVGFVLVATGALMRTGSTLVEEDRR
jgi:uncharacterized membrane protein HdeD (DUF308 family)